MSLQWPTKPSTSPRRLHLFTPLHFPPLSTSLTVSAPWVSLPHTISTTEPLLGLTLCLRALPAGSAACSLTSSGLLLECLLQSEAFIIQPVYSCNFSHSVLQFPMLLSVLSVNTSNKPTCLLLFPPVSININISVIM